jgi:hypothetical protein
LHNIRATTWKYTYDIKIVKHKGPITHVIIHAKVPIKGKAQRNRVAFVIPSIHRVEDVDMGNLIFLTRVFYLESGLYTHTHTKSSRAHIWWILRGAAHGPYSDKVAKHTCYECMQKAGTPDPTWMWMDSRFPPSVVQILNTTPPKSQTIIINF